MLQSIAAALAKVLPSRVLSIRRDTLNRLVSGLAVESSGLCSVLAPIRKSAAIEDVLDAVATAPRVKLLLVGGPAHLRRVRPAELCFLRRKLRVVV